MPTFYHVEFFESDGRLSHNAIATIEEAVSIAGNRRLSFGEEVPLSEALALTLEDRGLPIE